MDFWLKQTTDKPLFPDILWARPENRQGAGKLLVVGGNAHGFASIGEAFTVAESSGAGTVRAILPDSLQKLVGTSLVAEFVPCTPHSGGFSQAALGELLQQAAWADAVLIAGDLGRNAETSIALESFTQKFQGLLTVTKDTVDYFYTQPALLAERDHTLFVLSLVQLQRLGTALKFETPFLLSMGMVLLVQALHDFTLRYPVIIVTKELDHIVIAFQGRVSSTKLAKDKEIWCVQTAATATTFWLQNPGRPFEAITSSLVA